MKLVRTEYEIG